LTLAEIERFMAAHKGECRLLQSAATRRVVAAELLRDDPAVAQEFGADVRFVESYLSMLAAGHPADLDREARLQRRDGWRLTAGERAVLEQRFARDPALQAEFGELRFYISYMECERADQRERQDNDK
jgi:hypothetical protein